MSAYTRGSGPNSYVLQFYSLYFQLSLNIFLNWILLHTNLHANKIVEYQTNEPIDDEGPQTGRDPNGLYQRSTYGMVVERSCFGSKTANFAMTRILPTKYFAPAGAVATCPNRTADNTAWTKSGNSGKVGFWGGARPRNNRSGAAQVQFREPSGPCVGPNRTCQPRVAMCRGR